MEDDSSILKEKSVDLQKDSSSAPSLSRGPKKANYPISVIDISSTVTPPEHIYECSGASTHIKSIVVSTKLLVEGPSTVTLFKAKSPFVGDTIDLINTLVN